MKHHDYGALNREKRILCFSKQVFRNNSSTFLKVKGCLLNNESKKTLHYNIILDIHSTESSFIMFNFTVFVNIRMISSDELVSFNLLFAKGVY